MPELAEVEFYRKQWNAGIGCRICAVEWHAEKRLFRAIEPSDFVAALTGAKLCGSEARAKQMLFRFSRGRARSVSSWLGIHLGMTGKLRVEGPGFMPDKHDHLVLFTSAAALVFSDPRMFGRVRFQGGSEVPDWWSKLPPAVTSPDFTFERMWIFLRRRARLAVKSALLIQDVFPGVGNWMADEILWQARISPRVLCGRLTKARAQALWRKARQVCRVAMATVGVDFSDPPRGWFFHARWANDGRCPRCHAAVKTATIGGRTTRWCAQCQR